MKRTPPTLLLRLADAGAKRSRGFKVLSLITGGLIFLVLLPAFLFWLSQIITAAIAPFCPWLPCPPRLVEIIVATPFAIGGLLLLGWSTLTQWRHGHGTPAQLAPTQRLVTTGPYALCRNPIELGAILYYLGLGTMLDSLGNGIICAILAALLGTAYHYLFEEAELAARFGEEYLIYREKTPFLIPRFKK